MVLLGFVSTVIHFNCQLSDTEEELVREVCELVRVNSRVSGKAPLDPAELKRHERLEDIRKLVDDARKKKPRRPPKAAGGPCSTI